MYAASDVGRRHAVSIKDKRYIESEYSDEQKQVIIIEWNTNIDRSNRYNALSKLKEKANSDADQYLLRWIAAQADAPQSVRDYLNFLLLNVGSRLNIRNSR